jgi:hypothetical protein
LGVFCPVSNEYYLLVQEIKNSCVQKYREKSVKFPLPAVKKDVKKQPERKRRDSLIPAFFYTNSLTEKRIRLIVSNEIFLLSYLKILPICE